MRIIKTALAALGVLALSASLAQAAAPVKQTPQVKNGDVIKPFTLLDLEGKEVSVKFDKKVNVLSFWVSTCSLCKEELKTLNELSDKFKDTGFTVVSTDFGGSRIVNYVLKETQTVAKVPILMDQSAEIATKQYGITKFPFLLILNKEGKVMFIHDGWEADSAQRIEAEIEYRLK